MRIIASSSAISLLVALSFVPAAAQDRNIAVRPGNAPEIEILEPAEWRGEATRNIGVRPRGSVRVVGLASHASGVSEVTIDGARASLRPDPNGATRFTGYVRGEAAGREVVVVARTGSGRELTARFGMEAGEQSAAPPADPAAAWSQSADFRGERWAVVVGISEYADPDITPLRYADDDALAFHSFLVSENAGLGGFKEENVLLLLNEQASFRNIRYALRDFLKQATDDDVVVVYFAGHGAPDPDRPENLYLITHDTESERVASTGFPMADMDEAIRDTYARSVITITDACHSAGVGGRVGLRAGERMNPINQAFLDRLNTSTGVLVSFTASQANQYSQEHERWGGGHGVFTHYMLRALEGEGDEDGDGIVSLGEMMEWTRDRVRRETRNAQIPTISQTAFDWSWPMAVVTGEPIPVLAEAPKPPEGLAPTAPVSASAREDVPDWNPDELVDGAWFYRTGPAAAPRIVIRDIAFAPSDEGLKGVWSEAVWLEAVVDQDGMVPVELAREEVAFHLASGRVMGWRGYSSEEGQAWVMEASEEGYSLEYVVGTEDPGLSLEGFLEFVGMGEIEEVERILMEGVRDHPAITDARIVPEYAATRPETRAFASLRALHDNPAIVIDAGIQPFEASFGGAWELFVWTADLERVETLVVPGNVTLANLQEFLGTSSFDSGSPPKPDPYSISIRNRGRSQVTVPAGTFDAYELDVTFTNASNRFTWRFLVSARTPHVPIRIEKGWQTLELCGRGQGVPEACRSVTGS